MISCIVYPATFPYAKYFRMIIKLINIHGAIFLLMFSFNGMSLKAGNVDTLFYSDEVVDIELRCDFSAIQEDRVTQPEYHDGELIYHTLGHGSTRLSVRVMVRGNFRLDTANCNFPPLFISFKKEEVSNTLFENQGRLKLVTPCHGDEDVIEEFLIYKMYNQVTDVSFNARLVKVNYINTSSGRKVFERYSFFIEDKDHVAERNNSAERIKFLTPFDINRENLLKLSVFQYMIGNKDWYVTSRKNIVIIFPDDSTLAPLAVPYDFDLALFVDAAYTKPAGVPDHNLSKKRIYRSICFSENEFNEVFAYYRNLRPKFESIIKNTDLIPKRNKTYLLNTLAYFYDVTENRDLFVKEFLSNCQTKKDFNIPD